MSMRAISFAACLLAAMSLSCSPPENQNVELVGPIGGFGRAVAVNGNYAYMGEGAQFTILDVSDPSAPAVAARLPLPDFVRGVAVSGSLAYVADRASGLQIIDVPDPSATWSSLRKVKGRG